MKLGDKIHAKKMPKDSFYKEVKGVVIEVSNGFVKIRASQIMDKWSKAWESHPTSCMTNAKIEDCLIIK